MDNRRLFLIFIILGIPLFFGRKKEEYSNDYSHWNINQYSEIHLEDEVPPQILPNFLDYKPIRSVSNLGKVLGDIESHMPAGHIYRSGDKVTWAHETTHGINSNIRNTHGSSGENGFYVLENRAIILKEPNTTVREIANLIPKSLRGRNYNLYLVSQAGAWNHRPLYIFDEWVAYTNGAATRLDLGIQDRGDTVGSMLEFNIYALYVAKKTNDEGIKEFLRWNLSRTMEIYNKSKNLGDTEVYSDPIKKLRSSSEGEELRSFMNSYFGGKWTANFLR